MNAATETAGSAAVTVIDTSSWKLAGVRSSREGQKCDHCPRILKNLYDVVNSETGEEMAVGRGCCKKVTGWTLTAAEAAHRVRWAREQERQAAVWAEFTAIHSGIAATVEADAASWRPAWPGQCNLAAHFRLQVSRGAITRAGWERRSALYMSEVRLQQAG